MRAYSTAAGSNLSVPFFSEKLFLQLVRVRRERERAHYRLHKSLFVLLRPFPCVLQHWLKEQVPKRAYTSRACVFLKMTFYLCVSGCGRYLAPRDGHERCIACLDLAHTEAAFVDESCTHCGKMTISELRSRLQLLQRGGVPVPLPRSNPPQRVAASGDTGDLRITVSAFPSGNQPPRNPHSSCTPQPAELPEDRGGPSQRCAPSVSFGAPLDDRMSIAASEGESDFAGDDMSAQLPPSGTVAVPDTDPEMMAMLSRAANRVGLVWNPPLCPEPQGWTIGFSGWHELVLSHPPRFLSSRICMKSSLVRGRHLLLPETAPVGPPPSPPLMAVRLRGTHASPLWSGPWLCSCALTPPVCDSVAFVAALWCDTAVVGQPAMIACRCFSSVSRATRRSARDTRHNTHVLRAEIAVLLAKDAIELVPPADMRSGFYSPYFIVSKKSGGLRPILDLRVLNRRLHKLPFKMLTQKRIFECIRPRDWFAAIDLKDAYFHVSILPRHRPFLCFAFEGRAYQYKVLPFGLALSPRVFTKVVEGALVPMREQGVRISTTGSFSLSLGNSYANTGIWCSVTSASWAFRSTGKRANSPQCRGSLFSVWSLIRSNSQHTSQRNVLSRCWTDWIHSGAGQRSHWNFFRGSWGIWRPQRQ